MKFLYLTHNQNTRVRHLLKELTDTTSLADMLRMARVCEGTVHSEEISKQYLESVKTVKQVDAIHQWNNSKSKHKGSLAGVPIVVLAIHPKSARHMAKSASIAIRKGISASFVIPSNVKNLLDPMWEVHPRTIDIHIVTYLRLTNPCLMTLFSLSKTQLQYSSKLKPDIPMWCSMRFPAPHHYKEYWQTCM